MASFDQHIAHALSNIEFLKIINLNVDNFWDWKVTTSFYVAVHLMNAHLSKKLGFTYRTHKEVDNSLNCENNLSIAKVDEETYVAYSILSKLSRRSRYLVHEKDARSTALCLTYDRHFLKSLVHLNTLMLFIEKEYGVKFQKIELNCIELKSKNLKFFSYK